MLIINPPTYYKFKKPVCLDLSKLAPISSLILNENSSLSKEKLIFCYEAVAQALQAYLNGDYTKFDAQTTTTCCHGISLLVRKKINELSLIDIEEISLALKKELEKLEHNQSQSSDLSFFLNHLLPQSVLTLTQLHILFVIKDFDEERSWRTVVQKLKQISPIGTKFCGDLVRKLQLHFSNLVAESYRDLLAHIPKDFVINDIPIKLCGKYVQDEYIKIDKYKRKYVACLYSMQVTLAYLIQQQAKIALICDLKCENGIFKGRYTQLFEGNGYSGFNLLEVNTLNSSRLINSNDPVIVFGGCTHSDYLDTKSLKFQITPWLYRFPSLVLACDTFYPQFPLVRNDPEFDSQPINPQEEQLKRIIKAHEGIKGVSSYDPSFFCLTHIYVASLKQIQQATQGQGEHSCLPQSIIPENSRYSTDMAEKALRAS